MPKQTGISLIELMLSLSLSSLMLLILFQYYSYSKQHYLKLEHTLEEFTEQQWIAALLQESIRRAGFSPCIGTDHLLIKDKRAIKAGLDSIRTEEQSITLRRMNDPISAAKIFNPFQIKIRNTASFSLNHPILIADCFKGEIHELQALHSQLITLKKPLNTNFSYPIFIGEWLEETFYIQKVPTSRLMYKRYKPETLSMAINDLSVSLIQNNPKIIRIHLQGSSKDFLQFDTRIRTP